MGTFSNISLSGEFEFYIFLHVLCTDVYSIQPRAGSRRLLRYGDVFDTGSVPGESSRTL